MVMMRMLLVQQTHGMVRHAVSLQELVKPLSQAEQQREATGRLQRTRRSSSCTPCTSISTRIMYSSRSISTWRRQQQCPAALLLGQVQRTALLLAALQLLQHLALWEC